MVVLAASFRGPVLVCVLIAEESKARSFGLTRTTGQVVARAVLVAARNYGMVVGTELNVM